MEILLNKDEMVICDFIKRNKRVNALGKETGELRHNQDTIGSYVKESKSVYACKFHQTFVQRLFLNYFKLH